MVVDQWTDEDVDRIFQALADATRRDIVRQVLTQQQSVSALAGRYAMSFAAVQKHVAVLERASLVTKERRGREQMVFGNAHILRRVSQLLDTYAEIWQGRVDRIDDLLTSSSDEPFKEGV